MKASSLLLSIGAAVMTIGGLAYWGVTASIGPQSVTNEINPVTGVRTIASMGPEFIEKVENISDVDTAAGQKALCQALPSRRFHQWPMVISHNGQRNTIEERVFGGGKARDVLLIRAPVISAVLHGPFGDLYYEGRRSPMNDAKQAIIDAEDGDTVLVSGFFRYDKNGCFVMNESKSAFLINLMDIDSAEQEIEQAD